MNKTFTNESAITKFFNGRQQFNKQLVDCIKNDINIGDINFNKKTHKFSTEKKYQDSFDEQITFSNKFTDKQKNQIDSVLFHKDNTDGVSCAYLCWKYLTDKNKDKYILFKGIQPDYNKNKIVSNNIKYVEKNHIVGKNVIILDMAFNKTTFDYIKQISKSMIVIDNHPQTLKNNNNKNSIFSTLNHAACASCFKFFYPMEKVPLWLQYIDSDDVKSMIPYLKHTSLFTTFMSVRIVKCNMITKRNGFDNMNSGAYEAMDKLLSNESITWMLYAGSYMNEIKENFNQILAKNAKPMKFYGYNVVILNLEFQGIDKNVARQAITNRKNELKKKGLTDNKIKNEIQFCVLWSCHNDNTIKITLIDDHNDSNQLKMNEIAQKISSESKYGNGRGAGQAHIGNFFLNNSDPGFLAESKAKNLSY